MATALCCVTSRDANNPVTFLLLLQRAATHGRSPPDRTKAHPASSQRLSCSGLLQAVTDCLWAACNRDRQCGSSCNTKWGVAAWCSCFAAAGVPCSFRCCTVGSDILRTGNRLRRFPCPAAARTASGRSPCMLDTDIQCIVRPPRGRRHVRCIFSNERR